MVVYTYYQPPIAAHEWVRYDSFLSYPNPLQEALDTGYHVLLPSGTLTMPAATITVPQDSYLVGQGIYKTILDFGAYAGVCIEAPGRSGSLGGFTVLGTVTAGQVGVSSGTANAVRNASWGPLRFVDLEIGLRLYRDAGYALQAYNVFDAIRASGCTTGVYLGEIAVSTFLGIFTSDCGVGLHINGGGGHTFCLVNADACLTGVHIEDGRNFVFCNGWLEGTDLQSQTHVVIEDAVQGVRFVAFADTTDGTIDDQITDMNDSNIVPSSVSASEVVLSGLSILGDDGSQYRLGVDIYGNLYALLR